MRFWYNLNVKTNIPQISNPFNSGYDTAIVGAGPSGLISAIESHQKNMRILIIEKMYRPALKLRISGKGSCNITNSAGIDEFIKKFGSNGKFLRQSFDNFFNYDLIEYFNKHGVEFSLERGGRYYPKSGKANEIVDVLIKRVKDLNIELITGLQVKNIIVNESGKFDLFLSQYKKNDLLQRNLKIIAKKVLIASGGRSYSATGSDGSGYKLAENLGHTIIPVLPALVPLKGKGDIPFLLDGLALKNCKVSVWNRNKKIDERFGEMEFRDAELAGPVILSISNKIVQRIKKGDNISISIDLKPSLDHTKLDRRILREFKIEINRTFSDVLRKMMPEKLFSFFSLNTGIPLDKKPDQITSGERKMVRNLIKDIRIEIKGSAPFSKAIVTSGGVSTREIDPKTMESKLVNGLYFAGEVIDINAETGGYNLQGAFSTGWVAGRNIKESLLAGGG